MSLPSGLTQFSQMRCTWGRSPNCQSNEYALSFFFCSFMLSTLYPSPRSCSRFSHTSAAAVGSQTPSLPRVTVPHPANSTHADSWQDVPRLDYQASFCALETTAYFISMRRSQPRTKGKLMYDNYSLNCILPLSYPRLLSASLSFSFIGNDGKQWTIGNTKEKGEGKGSRVGEEGERWEMARGKERQHRSQR